MEAYYYGSRVRVQGIVGTAWPQDSIACPENSQEVPGAGKCECHLGFKPSGSSSCVRYDCPSGGSYSKLTQRNTIVDSVGSTACVGGCSAKPNSYWKASDGVIYAEWPFYYTGQTCGGAKDAAGIGTGDGGFRDPPFQCPSGQCPGTFNGQQMCVACSAGTSSDGKTTTTTNPDGTTTTTTKDTVCTDSTCTTTTKTTTTNPDGTPVGGTGGTTTTQEQKPKETFCQENPTSPMCKEGRWGGACDAGFSCEGDAVQCAIARETHRQGCEWSKVNQLQVDKGQEAMGGGDRPGWHPFEGAQQSAFTFQTLIDTSSGNLPTSCPTDETIGVAGRSIVLPFSKLCGALEMMGMIAVGFAMLAALRIVFH